MENVEEHRIAITNLRNAKLQLMTDSINTPLTPQQLSGFKQLYYYPIDYKFRIEGRFSATGAGKDVTLKTTNGLSKVLKTAGTVTFEFGGKAFTLTVFINNNLPEFATTSQKLFIPFTDATNGNETFENGRFLPVDDPKTDTLMIVDFNKAMNPNNGYNSQHDSIIAPLVNQMLASFQSGERKFEERFK